VPKLIFNLNSDVTKGRLVFIAKDQEQINNNAEWNLNDYEIIEVSQSEFDSVKVYDKTPIYDGINVTYEDIPHAEKTQENYNLEKNEVLKKLNEWIEKNPNKPLTTNVSNYRDYLTSFNVSAITSPKSLEKHLMDQGVEVFSVFELI
jgi:hypothetical protein